MFDAAFGCFEGFEGSQGYVCDPFDLLVCPALIRLRYLSCAERRDVFRVSGAQCETDGGAGDEPHIYRVR